MDLEIILKDIQQYKRPKEKLLPFYIQERLNESLRTYYKEISNSLKFYESKDELRIMKKLGEPR